MAASETILMMMERPRNRLRVEPFDLIPTAMIDAPLSWSLFGYFRKAKVLDASLRLWNVNDSKFIGLSGPKAVGASIGDYLWLTVVTAPFLQISSRFQLFLEDPRQLNIDEVHDYLVEIIGDSSLSLDAKTHLSRRVQRAKSVRAIARLIDEMRE